MHVHSAVLRCYGMMLSGWTFKSLTEATLKETIIKCLLYDIQ